MLLREMRRIRHKCSPMMSVQSYYAVTAASLVLNLCAAASGIPESLPLAWQALPVDWTRELTGRYTPPHLIYDLRDPEDFAEEHGSVLGHHLQNVHHIGPKNFQPFDGMDHGVWAPASWSRGGWVWTLRISSPGAASHILAFSEIDMPAGGELVIFSPAAVAEELYCGAGCTALGFQDVPEHRAYTTLPVPGDLLVLQYFHPGDSVDDADSLPLLQIASVLHGLGDFLPQALEARGGSRGSRNLLQSRHNTQATVAELTPALVADLVGDSVNATFGSLFDMSTLQSRSQNKVAGCTPSIRCDDEWSKEAAGVVDIYAVDLGLHAVGLCTGSLLNRPKVFAQNNATSGVGSDKEVFILTADHCFPNKSQIKAFQNWVIIFEYEVDCKRKTLPSIKKTLQGVGLLFYDSESDVLLLSLPSPIPEAYESYLLGYDARMDAIPLAAVGIHHPIGQPKRISFANTSERIMTSFDPPPQFTNSDIQPTDNTHFMVTWTKGATQGGSSGSPLLDANTRRIVGVLSGGYSLCSSKTLGDYYGRLAAAYLKGLDRFLGDPATLGSPDDIKEAMKGSTGATYGELVTAFRDGALPMDQATGLIFLPVLTQMYAGQSNGTLVLYLTTAPALGDTIVVTANVSNLPDNAVDATTFTSLDNSKFEFNASNWKVPQKLHVLVDRSGWNGSVPGGILRFDVQLDVRSTKNESFKDVQYAKFIIQPKEMAWTDFAPLVVPYIPIKYPPNNLTSASGKAVFQFTPNTTDIVTIKVCRQKVPMSTAAGTVSIYMDGHFIATLSHDLYGNPYCIHMPETRVLAKHVYTVVVSDEQDLGAILNLDAIDRFSIKIYDPTRFPRVKKTRAKPPALAPAAAAAPKPISADPAPALPEQTQPVAVQSLPR